MRRMIQLVVVFIISVPLAGCNSAYYGGAPEPSFDVDKDLKQLADHFGDAISISSYYDEKDSGATDEQLESARNKFITGRLTMMNIRYIQFVRKSTSDKQLLDSSVEILGIGLNVAGVSFDSAATKTALAGAAAGVAGSKATIDKNYYFERTITALIAAMNAQRKKSLVPILKGMQKDINEYKFEQAVTDLHSYYFAGTFIGAIQAIQTDASEKERKQDQDIKIARLSPITKADVTLKESLTTAIGNLKVEDLDKAKAALDLLEPDEPPPTDIKDAKIRLQHHVRSARDPESISELEKIFREANIK